MCAHIIHRWYDMVNITLSLPEVLHRSMKRHSDINWSEVARRAIEVRIRDLELLDKITAKSRLTTEDVMELDEVIKKGSWARHKELTA